MLTGTRRTVLMLAGCQALSMTGGSVVGLTGAIVGNMLKRSDLLLMSARVWIASAPAMPTPAVRSAKSCRCMIGSVPLVA